MTVLGRLWRAATAPPAAPPTAGQLAGRGVAAVSNPAPVTAPSSGVPVSRTGQVTLNAAGAGTAQVFCPGLDWVIDSRSVSIASATATGATAQEYLNGVSDVRYLQGTYDAANDSSGRRQLLAPGDVIYVVFADGPPGAVATYRASGLAYPVGRGRAHL